MAREWELIDSLDLDKTDRYSYDRIADPSKDDDEHYPRLIVENRCYMSSSFRKLHLEVAWRQDGMQIAHIVHYPKYAKAETPILCLDLVAFNGQVTLAIVDATPVRLDRELPELYQQMLSALQQRHGMALRRSLPEWGREIFSDYCVAMRPKSEEELEKFIEYVADLTAFPLRSAVLAETHPVASTVQEEALAAHARYSDRQLKNEKTRRVLINGWGEEIADRYMKEVMFDHEIAVQKVVGQ